MTIEKLSQNIVGSLKTDRHKIDNRWPTIQNWHKPFNNLFQVGSQHFCGIR